MDGDDQLLEALGGLLAEQDGHAEAVADAVEAGEGADLDEAALGALQPLSEAELAGITAALPPAEGAKVLRFPRRWIAAPLLAAAAATVFVVWPKDQPTYTLELRNAGAQEWRGAGETGRRLVLKKGTRFDIVLSPAAEHRGATLEAWRISAVDTLEWAAPHEVDPKGAIRVTGTVGPDLPHAPGAWLLRFEVGEQRLELPILLE